MSTARRSHRADLSSAGTPHSGFGIWPRCMRMQISDQVISPSSWRRAARLSSRASLIYWHHRGLYRVVVGTALALTHACP